MIDAGPLGAELYNRLMDLKIAVRTTTWHAGGGWLMKIDRGRIAGTPTISYSASRNTITVSCARVFRTKTVAEMVILPESTENEILDGLVKIVTQLLQPAGEAKHRGR